MIPIDVVADSEDGERANGRGIDIESPWKPTPWFTEKSVVEPVDIHARHDHHRESASHPGVSAPTELLRDIDGGVADTILIGVLHRRDEDRAGTVAHRDHRDRPSGGLGTVGGLAEPRVLPVSRDALQPCHHLVVRQDAPNVFRGECRARYGRKGERREREQRGEGEQTESGYNRAGVGCRPSSNERLWCFSAYSPYGGSHRHASFAAEA